MYFLKEDLKRTFLKWYIVDLSLPGLHQCFARRVSASLVKKSGLITRLAIAPLAPGGCKGLPPPFGFPGHGIPDWAKFGPPGPGGGGAGGAIPGNIILRDH